MVTAKKVETIEVHLLPTRNQQKVKINSDDPAKIAGLLAVLGTAERTSDHKCGKIGTITIRKTNGSVDKLHILPGHDVRYYEYRYGSRINRVDRARFLGALKAIGVKKITLGP